MFAIVLGIDDEKKRFWLGFGFGVFKNGGSSFVFAGLVILKNEYGLGYGFG